MNLFDFAIVTVLMGAANRFRGGGLIPLPGETTVPDHKRTQMRRLTYSFMAGILAFNPWVAVVAFLGCLTGWGFPISAAMGLNKPKDWEAEFTPLDAAARFIATLGGSLAYHSRAYGITWLTLHGLSLGAIAAFTGVAIDFVLNLIFGFHWSGFEWLTASPWLLLWGGMGLMFASTKNWETGEWRYGALQGLALGAALCAL